MMLMCFVQLGRIRHYKLHVYMIFLIFAKTKKTWDVRTSNFPTELQRDLLPKVE